VNRLSGHTSPAKRTPWIIVIGYAVDGPLAAAFGPAAVFGVGATYGLLSSAAMLTLRSVRDLRRTDRAG
jgi:hypothetical protein